MVDCFFRMVRGELRRPWVLLRPDYMLLKSIFRPEEAQAKYMPLMRSRM